MQKFLLNLITEWRRLGLPFEDDTVLVAVSGGADSLGLLLAIDELRKKKKLQIRVVAAHFNHKLRGDSSDYDEDFVKTIALERHFELAVGHQATPAPRNVEQTARDARYRFLRSTAANAKAGWVLTAHTMNDQAETFLLNLLRGSGVSGLSGMRPVRDLIGDDVDLASNREELRPGAPSVDTPSLPFSGTKLARPLLRWAKRVDTENFVRSLGVEFRYDTMNDDMSFRRVRVRKMLLPLMKEFNPKIVETLARTAEIMQQRSPELGFPTGGAPAAADVPKPAALSIKDLKGLDASRIPEELRDWLRQQRGSLRSVSSRHIEAIVRLIHSEKSGRTIEIPAGGRVRRRSGRLVFENIKVDK